MGGRKMSKRQKKKNGNYQDETKQRIEQIFHCAKDADKKISSKNGRRHPDLDYGLEYEKRRIPAVYASFHRLYETAKELYPDTDREQLLTFWGEFNFITGCTYETQEVDNHFLMGAAVWIVDRLIECGKFYDAMSLISVDQETLWDEVFAVPFYDPSVDDDVYLKILYAIQNRNGDGSRRVMNAVSGKGKSPDTENRRIYEQLLALLPDEVKNEAIKHFESYYEEWIRRILRGYLCFEKQDNIIDEKIEKADEELNRVNNIVPEMPESGVSMDSGSCYSTFRKMAEIIGQKNAAIEAAKKLLEEQETITSLKGFFLDDIIHSASATKDSIADTFTEIFGYDEAMREIAEPLCSFAIDDPYEMCFALLYLADTGSDLLWAYGPGVSLTEHISAYLPWYDGFYDDYDSDDEENIRPIPKRIRAPEIPDFYSLNMEPQKTGDNAYSCRTNLARIIYQESGGILPRNLHGYEQSLLQLAEYGITGKRALPYLMMITLLGAGYNKWIFDWNDIEEKNESPEDEPVPVEAASDNADLLEKIKKLEQENAHLRQSAYSAKKEAAAERKKNETAAAKAEEDKQELLALRELLINRSAEAEEEEKEQDFTVSFPYEVQKRSVVFGGHESWVRAIKPMLTGDIRFISRDADPNVNLIRSADVIWLQTNSISHAAYYKIINQCRQYQKQLEYFQYASAEKCARQLAKSERESHGVVKI